MAAPDRPRVSPRLADRRAFSEKFAIAAVGYYYQQITDDKDALPLGSQAENFDASGVGVGATMVFSPKMFGRDINLIGQWIHDLDSKNRLESDQFMFSYAFKF